jgi:hypothetical protein
VDEFAGQDFDYVLTVCDNAKENCPVFFGRATRLHHCFNDPAAVEGVEETRLDAFRNVRDEIRAYLKRFRIEESGARALKSQNSNRAWKAIILGELSPPSPTPSRPVGGETV